MNQVPVFINCRDRLTPLVALVDYLERAGCEHVYLLDNASTYPPLLQYYEETPHTVIRLEENHGHKWFWESGLLDQLEVRGRYVFSDPDTVPIEECPLDAIDYFGEVLDRYPGYKKVGFGLKIDDIPDHFRLKPEVIVRQSGLWHRLIAPRLYEAPIDTTFALYRSAEHAPQAAIRTGYPYLVRHTTWYLDSDNVPAEHRYYVEHEEGVSRWSREELGGGPDGPTPERARLMREKLERLAARPGAPAPVLPDWDERSPEVEFCDFVASLVRMVQPAVVVETGTGDGFVTRRILEQVGADQRLLCFEERPERREALRALPDIGVTPWELSHKDTPDEDDFSGAAMSVLGSASDHRVAELTAWWRSAPPGALVIIHGVCMDRRPDEPRARLADLIRDLGIPGTFLKNPRGAFLGVKPEPLATPHRSAT